MCKVNELIVYLLTLPLDADVQVLKEITQHWETWAEYDALEIGEYSDNLMFHKETNTLYLGDD